MQTGFTHCGLPQCPGCPMRVLSFLPNFLPTSMFSFLLYPYIECLLLTQVLRSGYMWTKQIKLLGLFKWVSYKGFPSYFLKLLSLLVLEFSFSDKFLHREHVISIIKLHEASVFLMIQPTMKSKELSLTFCFFWVDKNPKPSYTLTWQSQVIRFEK